MLHDVSGHRCLLQRYTDVDAGIIDELDIAAVFISGNGALADLYDPADLVGLADIVRSGRTPVFGFCGGLQFMGATLGARLDRIGRLDDGEVDPHPTYEAGWRKELGYQPVELVGEHPPARRARPTPGLPAGAHLRCAASVTRSAQACIRFRNSLEVSCRLLRSASSLTSSGRSGAAPNTEKHS